MNYGRSICALLIFSLVAMSVQARDVKILNHLKPILILIAIQLNIQKTLENL